jgi:sulfatase modifying factor 1
VAHFVCPECGSVLEYPEHGAGSIVRCRSCRQLVMLRPGTVDASERQIDQPESDVPHTPHETVAEPQAESTATAPVAASLSPADQAHELMKSCRFAEAADLLAAAPRERRQQELTSLLMHVQYLRSLREAALESLSRPGDATADVERYLRALQSENLRDAELELQIQRIRQAVNSARGGGLVLILAIGATLALLGSIWLAFFGETTESIPPGTEEDAEAKAETSPQTAQSRFANALKALRSGNRSEAAASWASGMAVSKGEESAESLEEYWKTEKARLESLAAAERKTAAEQLKQIDELAQSGNNTLRVRLVRCELLQQAADLLIAEQEYGDALGVLETASGLVPRSPRTRQLAGKAIEGMITAAAAGDSRFPSEIVVPMIDGASSAGLSAADEQRLRTLLDSSQKQSLEAFLQAPLQASLPAALDAYGRLSVEGNLPAAAGNAAAFDKAFAARISADLAAGRLQDALLGLERMEQIHGAVPDVVLDSLRMLPRSQLGQIPEPLRSGLLVRTSTLGQRFQLIEPGQFAGSEGDSLRTVVLTRWHYLAETELTRGQYKTVMGALRDEALSDACPILVTWDEAEEFCRTLSSRPEEQQRGQSYRLATEAEWEFACRAGGKGPWCFGSEDRLLPKHAWYLANSGGQLQEVGQLSGSRWGILDQHGNAPEWVSDWFGPRLAGRFTDPAGPDSGTLRTVKGGDCRSDPAGLSAQFRQGLESASDRCGVRLVQELEVKGEFKPR